MLKWTADVGCLWDLEMSKRRNWCTSPENDFCWLYMSSIINSKLCTIKLWHLVVLWRRSRYVAVRASKVWDEMCLILILFVFLSFRCVWTTWNSFCSSRIWFIQCFVSTSAKRSVNVAVVCSANAFDSSDCKQFASLIQRDRVGYICLVFCTRLLQRKKRSTFWNIDLIAAAFVWTLVTVNYLPACHCALNRLLASNYLWCDAWCLLCTLLCWIHDWIHSALHSFVS